MEGTWRVARVEGVGMSFLKRNRQRIEQAKRDVAEAEQARREAEAKWPEVRELEAAARAHKTVPDDLTTAFLRTIGGRHA